MTRNDSGKYKRIRNNPQARIAPCTIRGKITGPEFAATARVLPQEDWPMGAQNRWSENIGCSNPVLLEQENIYLEIESALTVFLATLQACVLAVKVSACMSNLPHSSVPC